MKVRTLGLMGATLAFLSLADGRVVRVPSDAPDIQAGLDSLVAYDTVWVACGTYEEFLFAPAIPFVMLGDFEPDSGENSRPFVNGSDLPGADTSSLLILPRATKAVIENFRFQNGHPYDSTLPPPRGIHSWADSVILRNCLVDTTLWGFKQERRESTRVVVVLDHCQFRYSIQYGASSFADNGLQVHQCSFSGPGAISGSLAGSGDSSQYVGCVFRDAQAGILLTIWGQGVSVLDCEFGPFGPSTYPAVDSDRLGGTFERNYFHDCLCSVSVLHLEVDSGSAVNVRGNRFERCRGQVSPQSLGCIEVTGGDSLDSASVNRIEDNVFLDNSGSVASNEIFISRGRFVLSGNRFGADSANGLPSVLVDTSGWLIHWSSVVARENSFQNCGYAAVGPATMDARFNWWGDSSGPFSEHRNPGGQGDTVAGELQFIPWLTDTSFLSTPESRAPSSTEWDLTVLYPNPFNSSIRIVLAGCTGNDFELSLHNLLGQVVGAIHTGPLMGGELTYTAPAYLASGIYFLKASDRTRVLTKKVILMK